MRVEFSAAADRDLGSDDALRTAFAPLAARSGFDWYLARATDRPRMLIAVSKASHSLTDLLRRWQTGTLAVDIVGVVSNHPDLRRTTEWHGIPFHELSTVGGKPAQETALLDHYERTGADGAAQRPLHQHPPQLPAQLQGCPPLSPRP